MDEHKILGIYIDYLKINQRDSNYRVSEEKIRKLESTRETKPHNLKILDLILD